MSFAGPVNLLTSRGRVDCNIFSIKNLGVSLAKQENILQKLAFESSFEELSLWVRLNSDAKKFIAKPKKANVADCDVCLTKVQEPLMLALQDLKKRRKNGRDRRLLKAVQSGDYTIIADILASAAWTYWQNHGFQIEEDEGITNISAVCQFENDEKNQQKKEFQKAQIEHIGAIVDFEKANKKGAYQECLDFKETEEILEINDFED